jgi:hypothetical protein
MDALVFLIYVHFLILVAPPLAIAGAKYWKMRRGEQWVEKPRPFRLPRVQDRVREEGKAA